MKMSVRTLLGQSFAVMLVSSAIVFPADSERVSGQFTRGDAVEITAFPDTAHFINGIYPIDDSGCVQIPVAGIVRIDTMSEQALIAYLSTLYVRYLPFPNLQVRPLVRLSLLGGFRNPGLYYLSARASVWDAIALAGGPAREDGLEKIRWERGHACMKSDMVTLIETGTSLAAAGIVSGDRFCVTAAPRRDRWEIFRSDVVPVLSLSISAVATGATLYVAYQAYHGR